MRPSLAGRALLLLLLAGCARPVEVATGVHGQFAEASRLLILEASDGPVPLSVDGPPATTEGLVAPTDILEAANDAVAWSAARFAPGEGNPERFRVLLRFQRVPADPAEECAGRSAARPAQPAPMPGPGMSLHAIACRGAEPVADVIARSERTTPAAARRLVRGAMDRLFPGGSRGWGFPGVSLGVGIGTDGAGVGVGVGF